MRTTRRRSDSVMLPDMPARPSAIPRVTIVGAGNLASALAPALRAANYIVDEIVSRSRSGSSSLAKKKTQMLAREVHASAVTPDRARLSAGLIWFCVPDRQIAGAAESLRGATDWKGKIAFHSSGALASDALDVLRKRGAAVASVHPLMTFVNGSRPSLEGVAFALEGDSKALRAARSLVRSLGAKPFSIHQRHKAAYHAWGMFASPLLIALLAVTERVAGAAGVKRKEARERIFPILRQTLANYERMGAPPSFSGPIVRGDIETVKKHLEIVRGIPEARDAYLALARSALRDLPVKNRAELRALVMPGRK
jgi:predicted short-subunit dehydrogenase-like oxidoreductase (DUF2520 family)